LNSGCSGIGNEKASLLELKIGDQFFSIFFWT
jgi:hypothetical protein